jgi:hypothetical protein
MGAKSMTEISALIHNPYRLQIRALIAATYLWGIGSNGFGAGEAERALVENGPLAWTL